MSWRISSNGRGQAAPQADDPAFFPFDHHGGQPMRAGGTIGDPSTSRQLATVAHYRAQLPGLKTFAGWLCSSRRVDARTTALGGKRRLRGTASSISPSSVSG